MHVHPDDASRLGLADGGSARGASRAGSIEAPVEVTDAVMPGVVSIPHGWGHGAPGADLPVAARYAGVNSNALSDELDIEPVSGNAVLNGIPVAMDPASSGDGLQATSDAISPAARVAPPGAIGA